FFCQTGDGIRDRNVPGVQTCALPIYIGEQLEVGGCMENLLRIRVGRFRIEESIRIDAVAEAAEEGRLKELLIPLDRMFEDCRKKIGRASWRGGMENGGSCVGGIVKVE